MKRDYASMLARLIESHPDRRYANIVSACEGFVTAAEIMGCKALRKSWRTQHTVILRMARYDYDFGLAWFTARSVALSESGFIRHDRFESIIVRTTGWTWSGEPKFPSSYTLVVDFSLKKRKTA